MLWSLWSSLIAVHRDGGHGPSRCLRKLIPPRSIAVPARSITPVMPRLEWDCRIIPPGESLETIFGEYWVDVARFNRIDRRHAHPGLSIKVPRRLEDLAQFTPLPLVYPPGELHKTNSF